MRQAVKRTLARLSPPDESGWRVLLYHAIGEPAAEDRLGLRISPADFREQMRWLTVEGFRVVPLASLIAGVPAERALAITFDDGYASQLEAAAILGEFGYPATFFVVPAFLNGEARGEAYWERWGYFGWTELAALAARGFEIGAHSATHVRLTRWSRHASVLEAEILGTKGVLEEKLGSRITSFSYPHGAFNEAVMAAVRQAGYQCACTSLYGANSTPLQPFALRRIEITAQDHLTDFAWKLRGRYDWFAGWQRLRMRHA